MNSPIKNTCSLSILMPVRNEAINLRIMLKMLRAVVEIDHEVLIVYDSEEDESIQAVNSIKEDYANIRLIHNDLGIGVINAIKKGVSKSNGKYILIFAADEVGPVLAIGDMLELMEKGCDFVSCTRYAHGGRRLGGSMLGAILSRIANSLFYRLSDMALTDATTGIKMFNRSVFDKLQLNANPVGWAVAFEMSIKAQLMNLKLGEVPIVSIDRLYGGESTFRAGPWIREYLRWFFWGIKKLPRRGKKKIPLIKIPASSPGGTGSPVPMQNRG